MSSKLISMDEVARHNSEKDCWVVIHGRVVNLTPFLDAHPGGSKVLTNEAGRDATAAFEVIHPKDILNQLPADLVLGSVDPSSVRAEHKPQATSAAVETETKVEGKPTLDHMLNVFDLECVAQGAMKKEGWAYYSSAADDEITLRENRAAFHRIWMRPRILVNVKHIDMSTTMMGSRSNLPLYVSATALGKLAHPDGEVAITRACHTAGLIQMIPTLASCSLSEMIGAKQESQPQWFQLYVNTDKKLTAEVIAKAQSGGCTALAITVDAPQLGRRERDMRNKILSGASHLQKKKGIDKKQTAGITQALTTFIDPSLCWADIPWFQTLTTMKIMLKGVQCGEDAVLAYKAGIPAIIVSNHGGRQLDFARSGIEVLAEVMDALKAIGADKKMEVYMDGGVRRGTDIFKALALGARGVGIGRPVLHGLAAFGQEGIERVFEIFTDELRMCMALMGCPTIGDIHRDMIDTRSLFTHSTATPRDNLSFTNYNPLPLPIARSRM